jgi:hypothetical protein
MRRILSVAFLVFLVSHPAAAQVVAPLDPSETYLPILQFGVPPTGTLCLVNGFCITEGAGVPLGAFASTTQLNALSTRIDDLLTTFAGLGTQLTAFEARLNTFATQIGAINTNLEAITGQLQTINEDLGKALEGAALASALKDAIPNEGDRFALRLNAAGASGEFAGAVGFAYAVQERTRVHVNYARSASENALSGGVNLSFR